MGWHGYDMAKNNGVDCDQLNMRLEKDVRLARLRSHAGASQPWR